MQLIYGITDKGRQRDHNEDDFIASKIHGNKIFISSVIDGVGGYEGGEVAAKIAKDTISKHLSKSKDYNTELLQEALQLANDAIVEAKEKGLPSRMACVVTLVVADCRKNIAYYAHVGDTRLYLFRDGSLVKLTRDQSFVGLLEDSGRISEAEAMQHPKRNEIDRALGFTSNLPTDYLETGSVPFLPNDMFLLCTDGLTDMVNTEMITHCLSGDTSLEEKCRELVHRANENGGKDNITVVLVKNGKEQKQEKAVAPRQVIIEPEQVEQIQEKPVVETIKKPAKKKTTPWLIPLVVLLIVLLAWLLFINKDDGKDELIIPMQQSSFTLNDTVSKSAEQIYLDPAIFGDTVMIDDTLTIDQDSLTLEGTGRTVFTSVDNHPLAIAPGILSLRLAKLELLNLQVVVGSNELSSVYLDSVRLKNVKLGIEPGVVINDTVISGRLSELIDRKQKLR